MSAPRKIEEQEGRGLFSGEVTEVRVYVPNGPYVGEATDGIKYRSVHQFPK